jgi:hypothetical protein
MLVPSLNKRPILTNTIVTMYFCVYTNYLHQSTEWGNQVRRQRGRLRAWRIPLSYLNCIPVSYKGEVKLTLTSKAMLVEVSSANTETEDWWCPQGDDSAIMQQPALRVCDSVVTVGCYTPGVPKSYAQYGCCQMQKFARMQFTYFLNTFFDATLLQIQNM